MKKQCFVIAFACAALFMAACNKHDLPNIPKDKRFLVKELKYGDRNYAFRYDHDGFIDTIAVSGVHGFSYVYQVARHGARIDSVALIRNGAVESTNADIRYDQKGRIIGFTYYLYAFYQPFPSVITLTYGPSGNIATITRNSTGGTDLDTLTFNHRNDLQRWTQDWGSREVTTFTFDAYQNPLHYIDGLFVMFVEETFFWEYIFSEHNSTGKVRQYLNITEVTTIQNQYDTHQRLIKKNIASSASGQDSLMITYFH
ncbi:hypothetical protein F0L74_21305 [Chitinophaga agrisoli]|uniref:YD repeat-containing protein n=1 Tax=Chitinophaga agrisoli TaxID=2607653 RepID=A0A5B2VIL1_9BACT|nr:hypothetical protein [Chitinophaga agrisoli]KAA2238755.1 hypothetical protein F0L74_21305 [Chitinophaga agrisoli]